MTGAALGPSEPRLGRSIIGGLASTLVDAALLVLAMGSIEALVEHVRALSLLSIWLVGAIVLAVRRPVRSHDPAELERENPLLMLALLVLPLIAPAVAAFGERVGLWMIPGGALVQWAGVALVAVGFGLRIAAISRLGSRFSPFVAVQSEHTLETSGVYARVRHPGYLGSWLAALGAVLAFGSSLGLIVVMLMLGALQLRMKREEVLLERHFGDAYRTYRTRSGGLFPRL